MGSSSRRNRCIWSSLLTVICILCISLIFISLAYRGKDHQVAEKILNENSIFSEKLIEEKCIPVCDSKHCVSQADILLKTVNAEVDPCDNFQTFLCGALEQRIGPDEHGSIVMLAQIEMLNKMKDAIETIDAPPESASSKLKTMYDSCVNIGSSDLRGFEDLKQFLKEIEILDWPYLTADFTFSEEGLSVILGVLTSYIESRFVTVGINTEVMESGNETYVEVRFVRHIAAYETMIQRDPVFDILEYFDIGSEDIELIYNDYSNVKSAILNLSDENDTICDDDICEEKKVHVDCSIPEDADWVFLCKTVQVFMNRTHLNDIITKPGIFVKENDIYIIKKFISTIKTLPNRSVANFFALRLLWNHLDEVNFFFRRKKQKYSEHFKSFDTQESEMMIKSRWVYCLEWVIKNMYLPLEKIYVDKYIDKSTIDEIRDMHMNFTSEVADLIVQQEWIPMQFRFPLGNWVKNIRNSFLENLEKLPSEILMNEYMKLFYPTSTSFFRNVLENRKNLLSCYGLYKISLNEPELYRPLVPSFRVGASHMDGGIVYHYGIILPPYHYPGHNRLSNRALFVPIVIHEVGHSISEFLSKTTEISESENYVNTYLKKRHCMENQFSKFEFKYLGGNLNGTQYFEENLGDNVAQEFFDKMLQNFESSEETISLPGILNTPKQQLYMGAGEGFCSKSSLKMDIHHKTNDIHAPLEYRLIGSLQNSRAYAETFHCPSGSYMNPTIKCTLFD